MVKNGGAASWKLIERIALFYFAAPVFIFLLFWFKAPYNFFFAALAGLSIYACFSKKTPTEPDEFGYSPWGVAWIFIYVAVVAFLMGVGGWMPQSPDYDQANGFFDNLKPQHWPWAYQFADGKVFYIVYYFGYHLVPAIFGALGGQTAIDIVSFISTTLGLGLGLTALGKYFKLPLWAVFLFFGFCGLDFAGNLFHPAAIQNLAAYPCWALPLRNFGPLETLFCAAHHLITPLLLLPLVLKNADEGQYDRVFLWLCLGLFWSPLTTLGVGILTIFGLRTSQWRNFLSLQNLGTAFGTLFPIGVFYSMRLYPDKLFFLGGYLSKMWPTYSLFLFLEIIVWLLLTSPKHWKDQRLWVAAIGFACLTFFTYGQSLDLLYRVSLSWQIFLFGTVVRSVIEERSFIRRTSFCIVYFLSALTPLIFFLWEFNHPNAKPLSEKCRYYPREFILSFDRISRQFWGSQDKNILSELLIKSHTHPILLPETSQDAEIARKVSLPTVIIGGPKNTSAGAFFDKTGQKYYRVMGTFSLFLVNRGPAKYIRIYFHVRNLWGREIPALITKTRLTHGEPRMDLYTGMELLEDNVPTTEWRKMDSSTLETKKGLIIPASGGDISIETCLERGITKIDLSNNGKWSGNMPPVFFEIKDPEIHILPPMISQPTVIQFLEKGK